MNGKKSSYISLILLLVVYFFCFQQEAFSLPIANGTFNLEIDVPSAYKTVERGESIHFTTKILNLDSEQRMDISLNYKIYNQKGESLVSESETMAIETQASFVGDLKIPEGAEDGTYYLSVTLLANKEEAAESTVSFDVVKKENHVWYYVIVTIISVILLALIIYILIKSKTFFQKLSMRIKISKMVKQKLKKSN